MAKDDVVEQLRSEVERLRDSLEKIIDEAEEAPVGAGDPAIVAIQKIAHAALCK